MTPPATNFWRIAGMSYLQVRIVLPYLCFYIFIQFRPRSFRRCCVLYSLCYSHSHSNRENKAHSLFVWRVKSRKNSNVSFNTKALNKIKYSKNSVSQQVFFLNLIFLYVVREQSCRFCSIGVEGTNEVKTFGTGWIQLQGQCLGRWYSNVQNRNHLFEPGRKINKLLFWSTITITITIRQYYTITTHTRGHSVI